MSASPKKPEASPADGDYVQMPAELRELIKKIRGFDPMPEPVHISKVLTPEQYARHVEERRAAEEARNKLEPGQIMPDGTIYLGRYSPVDRDGVSLSKIFNVFAAPEDLPKAMVYNETIEHIAGLKKWHGYNGTKFANDKGLYTALRRGGYKGGWIIPTSDILYGKDVDGKDTTPDNILTHRHKDSFKGTFKTTRSISILDSAHNYWSSTVTSDSLSNVWAVNLAHGGHFYSHNSTLELSCRPVRLVEVKSGGPS